MLTDWPSGFVTVSIVSHATPAGWLNVISVDVVDTVGAGDTFNAGILCYLENHGLLGKNLLESLDVSKVTAALQFAHEVAAITVSRKGADPPWATELGETEVGAGL